MSTERAWEAAHRRGRRAFYERATETIRSCPENYCLAVRTGDGWWRVYREEQATREQHDAIEEAIRAHIDFAPDPLADELGKVLPPIASLRSYRVDALRPYRVRASCGHVVIRKMREATAGVEYSPTLIIDRPNGAACDACQGYRPMCQHHNGTRCASPAVGLMLAPDGDPVPGGAFCWDHAAAPVVEYQQKLGECWEVLPIAVREVA